MSTLAKSARDQKFSLWNDHKVTSITHSCPINSFVDIERNVPVRIQKPRVVSNNSVNINFRQNVLGDQKSSLWNGHKLPSFTHSCRVNCFEDIMREMYLSGFERLRVVSNNSVNINFRQKVLETKSLACEMTRRLASITYSCRISSLEDIERLMYTVWIQKPRVVSNNSVNINFSQKVLGTKSLACEMFINLPLLLILVGINSFEDIERNVPVRIRKLRVVSNNFVNINFRQNVLGTKSLVCEMVINLLLLLILVGLIVSKILIEMYWSGFKNHEFCQITP